jgi:hypothetical protein
VTTSGHFYEAEQFERWNIINRVLPFDTLLTEAETFATKWPTGPTRAYGGLKSLLRVWDRQGLATADKVTIATVTLIIASDDAKPAIKAHRMPAARAALIFATEQLSLVTAPASQTRRPAAVHSLRQSEKLNGATAISASLNTASVRTGR